MRPIADTFSSPNGRWLEYWTPDGVADSAWIDEVIHADLRSFINFDIERPRTQSELDQLSQTLLELDPPYGTQFNLESQRIVAGEFWEASGTGVYPNPNWITYDGASYGANEAKLLKVGLISSPANLRALTLTADGNAIDADLVSSIPVDTDDVTNPTLLFELCHYLL